MLRLWCSEERGELALAFESTAERRARSAVAFHEPWTIGADVTVSVFSKHNVSGGTALSAETKQLLNLPVRAAKQIFGSKDSIFLLRPVASGILDLLRVAIESNLAFHWNFRKKDRIF